ncbi:MAG TPA: glycosyltransferase family 2 protein [Albitalea sp.]|nr:glycosyltransferase family 2 protein [Albitalea sp.]
MPDSSLPLPAKSSSALERQLAVQRGRRPGDPLLSLVVPVFNEEESIDLFLTTVEPFLDRAGLRFEIVFVNDGSRDDTLSHLLDCSRRDARIRIVNLSRNFGKEAALTAGIDRAEGEVVLLMDADGQHPPTLLPRMLAAWEQGADMVCAARASRADETWVKRVGTWLFYRLVNANPSVQIPVDAGDFRLMDRKVVDVLKALPERNRFMKGLYAWVGFRTEIIDYLPAERLSGHSTFSLRSLARLAFTGVTAFTNLPLRLWSALGALIAFGAIAFGVWIVVDHFIHGHDVPGWATLVTGMMLFSGVQLLSIGILGEYVGRIFDEVKQRPVYVVGAEMGRGALTPQADRGA